jgi:hypothetical protein
MFRFLRRNNVTPVPASERMQSLAAKITELVARDTEMKTFGASTFDELFDDRYICGSIVLSHQGCGYYDRLVIIGLQAGNVWSDGRVSDQGIAPLGCDFYMWYDRWLTDAIYDL